MFIFINSQESRRDTGDDFCLPDIGARLWRSQKREKKKPSSRVLAYSFSPWPSPRRSRSRLHLSLSRITCEYRVDTMLLLPLETHRGETITSRAHFFFSSAEKKTNTRETNAGIIYVRSRRLVRPTTLKSKHHARDFIHLDHHFVHPLSNFQQSETGGPHY